MKRISYIVLVYFAALTACTKDLDQQPVSNIEEDGFYKYPADFKQALSGVYNKLRTYPTQTLWLSEVRSDNVAVAGDGNRDWQGINDFSPNLTTTGLINATWNNYLNGIYTANTVLEAIANKGPGILSDVLVTQYTAECRFLRGFFYFELLRYFGKLPIVDKALLAEEVSLIPRSPVADVYNFIIQDLEFAGANLPPTYSDADLGRPTSFAAKGLLGRVYLTRSGPDYGIQDLPGLNSNDYEKALALFNEIIASNRYSFLTSFPSIFSYTNENNKEVLFDIQAMADVNGAEFPSQLVPIAYWGGLGLQSYDNGYGSGAYDVSRDMRDKLKSNTGGAIDIRDTFSIKYSYSPTVNGPLDTSNPFIKKYIDVARRGKDRANWPINFIVLRYTDILMMKAECILHGAAGTQTEVDAIVNQVRTRAGVPPVSNVTLDMLLEERRREFLGEGLRWHDLVRNGKAVTTMNAWRTSEGLTNIGEVKPQFVIYPIPQADILAKPGLYQQNDGYF